MQLGLGSRRVAGEPDVDLPEVVVLDPHAQPRVHVGVEVVARGAAADPMVVDGVGGEARLHEVAIEPIGTAAEPHDLVADGLAVEQTADLGPRNGVNTRHGPDSRAAAVAGGLVAAGASPAYSCSTDRSRST